MNFIKKLKYILVASLCVCGTHFIAFSCPLPHSFKDTGSRDSAITKYRLADSIMLDFTFKDTTGKPVHLYDFKGKFVFIDMWYSGCGFCISANQALYAVHEKMKSENIVFLSISVDSIREKWITSITENARPTKLNPWAGKYHPSPGTINLYTGGSGLDNDFVKKYDPDNYYPKLLLIDPQGILISDHPPRPDGAANQPDKLVEFIMNYIKKDK